MAKLARARPIRTTHSGGVMTPEDDRRCEEGLRPYLVVIGKVATNWSQIEQLLDDAIWTLADVEHDAGACITSQLTSTYNRGMALEALADLRGATPDRINHLRAILGEIERLRPQRNRIVHDPIGWHLQNDVAVVNRLGARRKLEMDLIPVNLQDYENTLKAVAAAYSKFVLFREAMFDELGLE